MNRGWGGFGCAVGIDLKNTADRTSSQRDVQTKSTSRPVMPTPLGQPVGLTVIPSSNISPPSGSRNSSTLPARTHPRARHPSPRVEPYPARAIHPTRSVRPDLSRIQGEGLCGGLTFEQVLTLSAYYSAAEISLHAGQSAESLRSRLSQAVRLKAAAENKTPLEVKGELNLLRLANGAIPALHHKYGVRRDKGRECASVAVDVPARPARGFRQSGSSSSSGPTNSGPEQTAPPTIKEASVDKPSESTSTTASDSLPSDMEVDHEDFESETAVDLIPEENAGSDLPQSLGTSGEYEVDYLLDCPTPGPPGGDWDRWDLEETFEPGVSVERPAYASPEYLGPPRTPGGFFDSDDEMVSPSPDRGSEAHLSEESSETEEIESDREIWSGLNESHWRRSGH